MNYEEEKQFRATLITKAIRWGKITAGVIVAAIIASCSIYQVDTGTRGVKTTFGEVVGEAKPEGIYFVSPIGQKITNINVQTQKWASNTMVYTRDVQQAKIDFVLTYSLDPKAAHLVFRDVGTDWAAKQVGQVVHEEIKREIGQYEAVDLIAQRDKAARGIQAGVTRRLAERNVIVGGVETTDINFTDEFENAVEAKVVAQQKAIEEQNRTVQKQELANQAIITAKGEAESALINAKATAQSIEIRAKALEQNAKLVEWEAVQKWNGVLPQYSMGGAVPFIQLPK